MIFSSHRTVHLLKFVINFPIHLVVCVPPGFTVLLNVAKKLPEFAVRRQRIYNRDLLVMLRRSIKSQRYENVPCYVRDELAKSDQERLKELDRQLRHGGTTPTCCSLLEKESITFYCSRAHQGTRLACCCPSLSCFKH